MARRYHRLRGRRNTQSFRYIVPALLIIGLIIVIIYGRIGNGENPVDSNDVTPEIKISEVEEKEPELVKELEKEPLPEPLPEPEPEPIPEPETKLPPAEPKQDSPDVASIPDVAPNPEAAVLIAEAMALIGEEPSRIIDARTKLTEAFRMPMSRQQRSFVKDQLSELANKWLFSKTIYPDDKLCGSYKVKSGDLLSTIAKKYKVPWKILQDINKISRPEALRAGETIKIVNGPFHARVDRSSFTLDLYLQDKAFIRSFRIGLGKPGQRNTNRALAGQTHWKGKIH